jgi:alpha-1,6-mannosyltransferase
VLLAISSFGAAATPVFNPVVSFPVLGVLIRLPTVALAGAFAGMAMVVVAWLLMGRFVNPGKARMASKSLLYRTLLSWAAPLVVVLPLFSRDVYSYLAQCKIASIGLDPYTYGPAQALGIADPLTRGIPNIWRDTPAPYGPVYLTVCRSVTSLSGDHVVTGVILQRLLELFGVAMIVWALPRLATRFGVQPASALWLGALNPLVLWHLIGGAHNDALMLGFMLAGFEIAAMKMGKIGDPVTRQELVYLVGGSTVVTLGAGIKVTGLAAMAFVAIMFARRLGGSFKHLVLSAFGAFVIAAVVLAAASLGTGLGFGWISALSTPGVVKSWMAPMTALGYLAGGLGILYRLGNFTETTIATARTIGTALSAVVALRVLWVTFRGRMQPLTGLGVLLGAVVLFGATVQPWYLLWAALPLAAGVSTSRFRTAATWLSAVIAMLIPPTGTTYDGRSYVLPEALIGALAILVVALVLLRRIVPLFQRRQLEAVG